jgi:biotin--protein ligase
LGFLLSSVFFSLCASADLSSRYRARFAASNLHKQPDVVGYDELINAIEASDEARTKFLKSCLTKLGLEVNEESSAVPSLSKLHLSALQSSQVPELLHSLTDVITEEDGEEFIRGEYDLFHLEKPDSRWCMTDLSQALTSAYDKPKKETGRGTPDAAADYAGIPKRIVSHDESWPDSKRTPYFNHALYYNSIQEYREKEKGADEWGNTFMYGEVVTSTNTLLEKSVNLLPLAVVVAFMIIMHTIFVGQVANSA